MMNHKHFFKWGGRIALLAVLLTAAPALCTEQDSPEMSPMLEMNPAPVEPDNVKPIQKVLFLGDSMTGWMAERFNAYADNNDFEVATIVWDGSTISKWANSPNLKKIIEEQKPDAVILSLGMNELFEGNPETRLTKPVEQLKETIGDIPFLWIGPPSWPGHSEGETLNSWLQSKLGEHNFFRSFDLDIPRQSRSNPHPNREGIEEWIDKVAEWIPENSNLHFKSMDAPAEGKFSRSKTFIYKRMKENL
ncbi:MAG: SGNH/GDSL hydrolase family protein [Muribaculaceae bacterium]|nr:SGNH/GDSL hydrolase family protein [Muribaculaceae bacterium]